MDDNENNGPTPFDDPDENKPHEFDPEWQKFLISQLPIEVQEKFNDPHKADEFFRRIDREIRKLGLVFRDCKLAVSPTDNKAFVQIVAEIDPSEDAYQTEKQLREMMWSTDQDRIAEQLEELRREVQGEGN